MHACLANECMSDWPVAIFNSVTIFVAGRSITFCLRVLNMYNVTLIVCLAVPIIALG